MHGVYVSQGDGIISDYCSSLDPIARRRYADMLKLLGLSEMEDSYVLCKFIDNMTLWPPLGFGHIFCYVDLEFCSGRT